MTYNENRGGSRSRRLQRNPQQQVPFHLECLEELLQLGHHAACDHEKCLLKGTEQVTLPVKELS